MELRLMEHYFNQLINHLSGLSRRMKITLQLLLDVLLIIIAFICSLLLHFGGLSFLGQPGILGALGLSVTATILVFWGLGLYAVVVRFITGRILVIVALGASVAASLLFVAGAVFNLSLLVSDSIIFATFVFLSIGGLRFAGRSFLRGPKRLSKQPVIIYGAREIGLQLLNALFHDHEYRPVALVDDDISLQDLSIGGLRVQSPEKIPLLVQGTDARVILLAIANMDRVRRREIVRSLEDLELEIKTVPGISDIISGKTRVSELRTISPEDLLGRDPVDPDPQLLGKNITGRIVMVSGAGGSIGSELCRQILTQNPSVLVLYDLSEFALYTIEADLSSIATRLNYKTKIMPILGSVQHSRRLEAVIKGFRVQTIYHAAAYKHVPLVEENVVEGIRNNVFGTLSIARAAQKLGVDNFILISTDKAVRPTNIMGATKRIAELICQAHATEKTSTIFSMVRFGNVLGSSGSVIPRFQAQIEAGGPVTVTHKDINRYFMTIPEAAQLVIQAGAMGQGGDVFVLDMGEPVKILDIAFSMVKLHGLMPYMVDNLGQNLQEQGDIPVSITGLRKGEKLYEELLVGNDPARTKHPRIMTASEASLPYDKLMTALDRLLQACEDFDLPTIIKIIHELPVDYKPLSVDILDLLWDTQHNINEEQNMVIEAKLSATHGILR